MSSSSAAHDAKKSAKKKRVHVDTTTAAAAEQKRAKKAPAAVASAAEEEPVVSSGAVVEAVVARPAEVKKKIGRPRKLPLPDGAPPPPKKKYQRRKPLGAGPQQRAQRTTKRADADADAAAVPLPPGPPPLELLHQRRARHREQWLATLLAAAEKGGEGEGVDDDDVVGGVAALQRLAVNLERGAYNHALTAARRRRLLVHPGCPVFWRLYVARTCALWRNMRSCPALMHSVRVGALAPRELETLSTMQLDLGHWREELEAKSKRDGSRFATRLVANTTEYTCRACGSTRCSYFEIQLRKADEPSDVFITCIDCSFRWKDDM
jgi:hypothetical protein